MANELIIHAEREHSELGGSSCDRWWNCPGSVRQSRGVPRLNTSFARLGTAAHEVADLCLKEGREVEEMVGRMFNHEEGQEPIECDDEMAEAVDVHLGFCRALITLSEASPAQDRRYWIEEPGTLEKLNPPAPMFGTSDFSAFYIERPLMGSWLGVLHIVDYKHGAGYAVEARGNPQMRYYALMAVLGHPELKVDLVRMTIVQPRAWHPDSTIRTDEIRLYELIDWATDLLAHAEATMSPEAELVPGQWCKFCPASGFCSALREKSLAEMYADFADDGQIVLSEPEMFTPDTLAKILDSADAIESWVNAVRAYALRLAESGVDIPRYKLVAKRGRRKWVGAAAQTAAALEKFLSPQEMYAEPKLKSPAQLEKLKPIKALKGKELEAFSALYETPSTGVNLVRAEMARPALPPSAVRDFDNLELGE